MFKSFSIVFFLLAATSCTQNHQQSAHVLPSKYESLEKIGELRKQSLLTEEEFEVEKELILNKHLHLVRSLDKRHTKPSNDLASGNLELDVCSTISSKYNAIISETVGGYCLDHSASFDLYSELQKNKCGNHTKIIKIPKNGYESTCDDGKEKKLVFSPLAWQYDQDRWLYENFYQKKREGIFVEIGSDDGIDKSNTYFFEKNSNWTGLCVEPSPERLKLLRHNRSSHCEEFAIANGSGEVGFLDVSGWGKGLSSIVKNYAPNHVERIERELEHCQC